MTSATVRSIGNHIHTGKFASGLKVKGLYKVHRGPQIDAGSNVGRVMFSSAPVRNGFHPVMLVVLVRSELLDRKRFEWESFVSPKSVESLDSGASLAPAILVVPVSLALLVPPVRSAKSVIFTLQC